MIFLLVLIACLQMAILITLLAERDREDKLRRQIETQAGLIKQHDLILQLVMDVQTLISRVQKSADEGRLY